jgi:hypothetical protein
VEMPPGPPTLFPRPLSAPLTSSQPLHHKLRMLGSRNFLPPLSRAASGAGDDGEGEQEHGPILTSQPFPPPPRHPTPNDDQEQAPVSPVPVPPGFVDRSLLLASQAILPPGYKVVRIENPEQSEQPTAQPTAQPPSSSALVVPAALRDPILAEVQGLFAKYDLVWLLPSIIRTHWCMYQPLSTLAVTRAVAALARPP